MNTKTLKIRATFATEDGEVLVSEVLEATVDLDEERHGLAPDRVLIAIAGLSSMGEDAFRIAYARAKKGE